MTPVSPRTLNFRAEPGRWFMFRDGTGQVHNLMRAPSRCYLADYNRGIPVPCPDLMPGQRAYDMWSGTRRTLYGVYLKDGATYYQFEDQGTTGLPDIVDRTRGQFLVICE